MDETSAREEGAEILAPSSPDQIRNRSQRVVESPITGNVYRIRDYAASDAVRLKRLPAILDEEGNEIEDVEDLTEIDKTRFTLDFSERVIEECCLEPRFTTDPEEATDEILYIREIAADVTWLADEIVRAWADRNLGKSRGSQEEEPSTEKP